MHAPVAGAAPMRVEDLRREIVGIETRVPLLDGTERPYVFLDNAASTPALRGVLRAIEEFLPWYSGVHRGTGFKSVLTTGVFDAAHDTVTVEFHGKSMSLAIKRAAPVAQAAVVPTGVGPATQAIPGMPSPLDQQRLQQVQEEIRRRRLPGAGGWSHGGAQFGTEPTSLALLALYSPPSGSRLIP